MKAWIGKGFIIIGVCHSILGFLIFRSTISTLFKEGLFNTVNQQPDREAAFWFLFAGFALLLLGALIDSVERTHFALPSFLSWSFLSLTVVGVFIMPISGFWLMFVPTIGLFIRNVNSKKGNQPNRVKGSF